MENETQLFRKSDNSFSKFPNGHGPGPGPGLGRSNPKGGGGICDSKINRGGNTVTTTATSDDADDDSDEDDDDEDESSSKSPIRTFIRIPVPLPYPKDNPTTKPKHTPYQHQNQDHRQQKSKKSKQSLQPRRRSSLSAELEGRSSGANTNSSLETLDTYNTTNESISPTSIDDQYVFHGSRKSYEKSNRHEKNSKIHHPHPQRKSNIETTRTTPTHKYNKDFHDVVGDYGNVSSLSTHHNVHSSMSLLSMSTNNAITIAPSRNSILEPNVFDTGGRHYHNNHNNKRHNNHGHGGRRRRSKTPELVSMSRNSNNSNFNSNSTNGGSNNKQSDLQSVLNRLDYRIKNNFGDWSNMDDDTNFEYRSVGRIPGQGGHGQGHGNGHGHGGYGGIISTTIGMGDGLSLGHGSSMNATKILNTSVSLPPLYKNYQTVLKSSKGKLMDKTQRIAMSKDNNDPNSILSEAKRTLTQMGGGGKIDI